MTIQELPILKSINFPNLLYEGTKSLVYRGIREDDSQPVVIKLLKRSLPTHNEILNFHYQYNLLKPLDIDVIPKTTLETWQEKLALIMPDSKAIDLKLYTQGQPIKINDFYPLQLNLQKY